MKIDKEQLKALALAASHDSWKSPAVSAFMGAADPDTVLALLDEIEHLNESRQEARDLRNKMGDRLDAAEAENEKFEEGMRSLACQLGAGGYNAETLTAEQLVAKVTDGLAAFAESSGRLLDEVRAERDQAKASDQEATELCDALSVLLGQIGTAVRGPEEPKKRHGFHDLPSRVKAVVQERETLRSQVAALQAEPNSYQSGFDAGRAAEKAHAGNWRTEADGLRKDANLHAQLQRAAEVLPGAWNIQIVVERHAGWIEVFDDGGNRVAFDGDGHLGEQVSDALEMVLAMAKEAGQ